MEKRGRTALTGTPGTGKSTVARALGPEAHSAEVAELAVSWNVGSRRGTSVDVDLRRFSDRLAQLPSGSDPRLVVGHLSHLLPIRNAIVLRCHPIELGQRLRRSRRGTVADRRANVEAEAIDVILLEALRDGHTIWEVDTSGRSVAAVAREVRAILAGRRRPSYGRVHWLSDPRVTAALLRPRS